MTFRNGHDMFVVLGADVEHAMNPSALFGEKYTYFNRLNVAWL
jgi:hypothetical protein